MKDSEKVMAALIGCAGIFLVVLAVHTTLTAALTLLVYYTAAGFGAPLPFWPLAGCVYLSLVVLGLLSRR